MTEIQRTLLNIKLSYFTALGWHLISYLYRQVSYTVTCYQIQSTLYRHQIVPTLQDVTCRVCLHILLHVVGSCCTTFETSHTFSFVQMDATTPNIGRQCCVRFFRDCRKISLPLVLIKVIFCYRKESVMSGSTTHHFFMKLISDIH